MRIHLVDDNEAFRENLRLFIEEHLNYEVTGESANGEEFLECGQLNADVVLMDINMPGINGLDATKLGIWKNTNLRIIAVTQYLDMADLEQIIGAGFKGFVSKTNLFRDLDCALKAVCQGGYSFPQELDLKLTQ